MTYSNATFYLDVESGSDTARTALTSVTTANNGSGLVRCTKTGHGLVTGAVVDNTVNYTGAWIITVIDANTFDLVGSTYTSSLSVTVTPRGGSSKADAWQTLNAGATSARIAAGDTIRIKASPDETLVGNATWTNLSKTVTLASAVTANISDCETAWTATTNVTATADTSQFKENAKSAKLVIASAFTTGKAAYFATGTLDLSGYQQVSFWVYNSIAIAASTLSIRLCTDTTGDVSVHTVAVPALPSSNQWTAFTVNLGSNMNSAIASVALYCDLDPGTLTVQLDNIIACKASSSANSLSLTSIIGKVWNTVWVASTTYATNDIRKPTQPNRNGYRYKVTAGGGGASGGSEPTWPTSIGVTVVDGALTWTCEGIEDTWYAIQSINGTTVKLDNHTNCLGNVGLGYSGTTETVSTYKREVSNRVAIYASSNQLNDANIQQSGTSASLITYSGGWNRTDMTTQTGETWLSGQNGFAYAIYTNGNSYLSFNNYNVVRMYYGINPSSSANLVRLKNCHFNNLSNQAIYLNVAGCNFDLQGVICNNTNSSSSTLGAFAINDFSEARLQAVSFSNTLVGPAISTAQNYVNSIKITDAVLKNNATYAISHLTPTPLKASGVLSSDNATASIQCISAQANFNNCSFGEATIFATQTAYRDLYLFSQKHNQTANNHLITTDGGTIISATDQRHTASGISWKFRPTSTNRSSSYPLKLSIGRVACSANATVSVSIWVYRDNTNIKGQLVVPEGGINGVSGGVLGTIDTPSINTWTQSATMQFTPTEDGVVEIFYYVWDGVGTTNNLWIDDLTVSQ